MLNKNHVICFCPNCANSLPKNVHYFIFGEATAIKIRDLTFWRNVILSMGRSSRPEVFCKKDVLRNFAKFTGKHLCQSLFFNKVAGLRPATLFKKRLWHRCSPVNFVKFLRTRFFIEHLRWLLLYGKLDCRVLQQLTEVYCKPC